MKQQGQFLLFTREEFQAWLNKLVLKRKIKLIQQHHTWLPDYKTFHANHFALCESMKTAHLARDFKDIAQNLTTFPDGLISVCRSFELDPAGIKGANTGAICIENVGNFDRDDINAEQKKTILFITAVLCKHFKLVHSTDTIVYHHWFDLTTGKRLDDGKAILKGNVKTCPGIKFFGGNTVSACKKNFIPQVAILIGGLK